ncbi:hypothetical protein LDENG_00265770 [Lucifuga dentata]|nr:hypothetical protein LDENG_00265770 [Lucifuga dentata]
MYSWMLLVSFWIVALTLTSPLPPLFSLSIQSQGAGLWVEPSVHCEEFSCLDICGVHLFLWPAAYYSSWVLDDVSAYMLMAWILFLPLSWLLRTCLTLWRYLAVADFLVSSSWLPLACGIPRYL